MTVTMKTAVESCQNSAALFEAADELQARAEALAADSDWLGQGDEAQRLYRRSCCLEDAAEKMREAALFLHKLPNI